jgi:nickel-type superoxide dismutase maturation protease
VARRSGQGAGAEAAGAVNTNELRVVRSRRRALLAGCARILRIPARVVVAGPSMLPTLRDGDRCLVRRTRRVGPGDLVVMFDPERASRLIVKRVVAADPEGIVVAGDNPDASRDSRDFGAASPEGLVGVAWYRYGPADRIGRVR